VGPLGFIFSVFCPGYLGLNGVPSISGSMMKKALALAIIFFVALPPGCSKDDTTTVAEDGTITVSAGAVAHRDPSGNITVREASRGELDSLRTFRSEYDEIDNKYPGPSITENLPSFTVKEITEEGVFILEDGLKVKMSGIKCTANGADILNRFFDKESEEISFHKESTLPDGTVVAHVWMVDPSMPSIGNLSDTVVINKWCEVDYKNPSTYHQRYVGQAPLGVGPHILRY